MQNFEVISTLETSAEYFNTPFRTQHEKTIVPFKTIVLLNNKQPMCAVFILYYCLNTILCMIGLLFVLRMYVTLRWKNSHRLCGDRILENGKISSL